MCVVTDCRAGAHNMFSLCELKKKEPFACTFRSLRSPVRCTFNFFARRGVDFDALCNEGNAKLISEMKRLFIVQYVAFVRVIQVI